MCQNEFQPFVLNHVSYRDGMQVNKTDVYHQSRTHEDRLRGFHTIKPHYFGPPYYYYNPTTKQVMKVNGLGQRSGSDYQIIGGYERERIMKKNPEINEKPGKAPGCKCVPSGRCHPTTSFLLGCPHDHYYNEKNEWICKI